MLNAVKADNVRSGKAGIRERAVLLRSEKQDKRGCALCVGIHSRLSPADSANGSLLSTTRNLRNVSSSRIYYLSTLFSTPKASNIYIYIYIRFPFCSAYSIGVSDSPVVQIQ